MDSIPSPAAHGSYATPANFDDTIWQRAVAALLRIYGNLGASAFQMLIDAVTSRISAARLARPDNLKTLDVARSDHPKWFLRPGRPTYCGYVDRFAGDLKGCIERLTYLEALDVGVFHPLPLLKMRDGDSDGGFAVSDYREVDPRFGTMKDLKALAQALKEKDIALVIDVVCNHTAREHTWAQAQLCGDPDFADFYIVLKDEADVAAWSEALIDVFPDTAPGSFTYDEAAGGWVWTTFYPFQWDLNYANPRVFVEMLDVLFYLANAGVDGFRLDSTAFLWKQKGTSSRNLPQTHDLLQAFRGLLSLVAPGTFLLAEAIEGLDEVLPYFGPDTSHQECDIAYNNTVMTALWGALAEGRSDALVTALAQTQVRPSHGAWLNYVRCHDDIIWQALAGMQPQARLQAWSDALAGKNGFSHGRSFQAPPGLALSTCGMTASLCGVGTDPLGIDRMKLLYTVTYALDGMPMIYMGDAVALANDENFADDPEKAAEMRWLHRPQMDWSLANQRDTSGTLQNEIYNHLSYLSKILQSLNDLDMGTPTCPEISDDDRLMILHRVGQHKIFTCVANFSADTVSLPPSLQSHDLLSRKDLTALAPYQAIWTTA